MTDRGVSEVLGFVLVFSLVTASVGVVYVFGFSGLEETRDEQRIDNAERAVDVLADNMDDIHRDDAPNRATEIKLYDARLGLGDPVVVTVEITNVGTPNTFSVSTNPIVYAPTDSETRLVYSNGATFRTDDDSGVINHPPPLVLREEGTNRTVVVPMIETRPDDAGAISGKTTVLVRTDLAVSEVLDDRRNPSTGNDPDGDGGDEFEVTYTIETTETRADLWTEHLNDRFDEAFAERPCTRSGDTVECDFHTETLYVTATRIDVSIDR